MTLNGAIMELVMLSEHPIMPVIFKPSIQKIIETVSECEEPERTGRWINHSCYDGHHIADCDKCGHALQWLDDDEPKFCCECGAKMEVENE